MNKITSEKSKLGLVGVGYMGRPIAQRLLQSGFSLSAYDRHRTKAQELIRYGGTVADSVAELASSCDVLLSCLATDEAVLNIYRGGDGAFAHAHRGSLVIDLSTVNPETSQELSRLGSERGVPEFPVPRPRDCRRRESAGAGRERAGFCHSRDGTNLDKLRSAPHADGERAALQTVAAQDEAAELAAEGGCDVTYSAAAQGMTLS